MHFNNFTLLKVVSLLIDIIHYYNLLCKYVYFYVILNTLYMLLYNIPYIILGYFSNFNLYIMFLQIIICYYKLL